MHAIGASVPAGRHCWRSAEAVRGMLDRATGELNEAAQRGETRLKAPERMGRLGIA